MSITLAVTVPIGCRATPLIGTHDTMSPLRSRSRQGSRTLRPAHGFTLTEVLLAATIGAVLMTALAASVGTFAETVDYLDDESVADADVALARIAADVRYAWRVDVPTRSELEVVDGSGGTTRYYGSSGDLRVTLPTGEDGVLLPSITALTFENEEVERLREGATSTFSGVLHRQLPILAIPSGLELEPGDALALSFQVDSDAGSGRISGVSEQVVGFTPSVIHLLVAAAGPGATLSLDIMESRAPADARPRPTASSLNSVQALSGARIPAATVGGSSVSGASTSTVSGASSVSSPLFDAPGTPVPINISGVVSELEPGVAYTVVIRAGGSDSTILAGYPDTLKTSVQKQSGGNWARQSLIVPMLVSGTYRTTSTTASEEVSMVRTAVTTDDGIQRIGSAAVYSQVLADDPWLGVVVGDTAPGS